MTRFTIRYNTEWGESLSLVLAGKKRPMKWCGDGLWSVTVRDCSEKDLEDYTYVVVRDGIITRPEWSHHQHTPAKEINDNWIECPFKDCDFTRSHNNPIFDAPGFRGAGVAVPVFSLRSRDDFGIGEFNDLRILIDWAAATGQSVIQLLPVNDTTRKGGWEDSYPYSPVSSFALNPMYIHLQDLGVEQDKSFLETQARLNGYAEIDYPAVFEAKTALMRLAFEKNGAKDIRSRAFRDFAERNAFWLEEYAVFCARRDGDSKNFHKWIQFHLDRQLGRIAEYARTKEIVLKGDLPIGVSADSAEACFHPELFNLDCCAGAPPDFFSEDGQNWGFPTYNWDRMADDEYAWWKARLRKMSEYFGAFRIDHILGFFRIWEIPASEKSGKWGHFNPALPYRAEEIEALGLPLDKRLFTTDMRRRGWYHPLISPDTSALADWQRFRYERLRTDFFFHRHDGFWRRNAEKKLPELLGATGMLACGEDLGMIPDCVNGVMAKERILSLEMPVMEKGRPWPRLSVCTTSSHDMETLRMQQKEDPGTQQCRDILRGCLMSASMLAIFPIQDWLSIDAGLRREKRDEERINEPANPHHHWRYRLHIPLECLLGEKSADLNREIGTLLKDSERFNAQ